jgi:hypothetical protein
MGSAITMHKTMMAGTVSAKPNQLSALDRADILGFFLAPWQSSLTSLPSKYTRLIPFGSTPCSVTEVFLHEAGSGGMTY